MGVCAAVQAELSALGPVAESSVEGQTALALAAALDDRAGIQAGGLASTAKQLVAIMAEVRERYKPQQTSRLSVLRGTA